MSTSTSIKDEVLYQQGRKMIAAANYEAAIDFFSELLQARVATYGDKSLEVAPAWFEYGRALLLKEQENPSDDLLGAAAAEAKKQAQALGQELGGGGNDEEEDEEEEEQDDQQEEQQEVEEDDVTDMEIAWEALETSRMLFEEEKDPEFDMTLSEVYECLGDVSKFNGNYEGAVTEYTKSLRLREALCADGDRILAQAYYTLAVAHVYWAGEEGCKDKLVQKKRALKNYQAARKVLLTEVKGSVVLPPAAPASSSGSSGSSSSDKPPLTEKEERAELSDEIEETIVALKDEIVKESLGLNGSNGGLLAAGGGSTTTIGFGSSSSTSSSGSSSTTIGFGSAPSMSSGSSSSASAMNSSTVQGLPLEGRKKSGVSSSGEGVLRLSQVKPKSDIKEVDDSEQVAKKLKTV